MKKTLSIAAAIILLIIVLSIMPSTGNIRLVGPAEFVKVYNSQPSAVLIDVRTPFEFAAGHMTGAINIDYENASFKSEIQKLDPEKTYFVYCRSGNRSARATEIMKSAGLKNIIELQGGVSGAPELLGN